MGIDAAVRLDLAKHGHELYLKSLKSAPIQHIWQLARGTDNRVFSPP